MKKKVRIENYFFIFIAWLKLAYIIINIIFKQYQFWQVNYAHLASFSPCNSSHDFNFSTSNLFYVKNVKNVFTFS